MRGCTRIPRTGTFMYLRGRKRTGGAGRLFFTISLVLSTIEKVRRSGPKNAVIRHANSRGETAKAGEHREGRYLQTVWHATVVRSNYRCCAPRSPPSSNREGCRETSHGEHTTLFNRLIDFRGLSQVSRIPWASGQSECRYDFVKFYTCFCDQIGTYFRKDDFYLALSRETLFQYFQIDYSAAQSGCRPDRCARKTARHAVNSYTDSVI
jgi:hypothetical protein